MSLCEDTPSNSVLLRHLGLSFRNVLLCCNTRVTLLYEGFFLGPNALSKI